MRQDGIVFLIVGSTNADLGEDQLFGQARTVDDNCWTSWCRKGKHLRAAVGFRVFFGRK